MRTPHVVNEFKKFTCDSPIFMINNIANVIRLGVLGTGIHWISMEIHFFGTYRFVKQGGL
jgi:hypothetical protein